MMSAGTPGETRKVVQSQGCALHLGKAPLEAARACEV
jgi:hypothetical protein